MERDETLELLAHYAVLILIVLVALAVVDVVAPDLGTWARLAVAVLLGILYAPVTRLLGVAPARWGG